MSVAVIPKTKQSLARTTDYEESCTILREQYRATSYSTSSSSQAFPLLLIIGGGSASLLLNPGPILFMETSRKRG